MRFDDLRPSLYPHALIEIFVCVLVFIAASGSHAGPTEKLAAVTRHLETPGVMRQERVVEIDGAAHFKGPGPSAPWRKKDKNAENWASSLPAEIFMAVLSEHVYDARPFEGWELGAELHIESFWLHPGESHAALYTNDEGLCALLFGVTGDLSKCETLEDSKVDDSSLEECGLTKVNSGMFHEFQNVLLSDEWTQFGEILQDRSKCKGVVVGGHALGGALATMFATCANHAPSDEVLVPDLTKWDKMIGTTLVKPGKMVKTETTSGLYTFGMPPVSKKQLYNNASEDGTFAGGRFYIEDKGCFDPVPFGCGKLGYLHPKVASIRLNESDYGIVSRVEHEAWAENVESMPDFDRSKVGLCDKDGNYSKSSSYVSRIKRAPPLSDFTDPGEKARRIKRKPTASEMVHAKEGKGNIYHAQLKNYSSGNGAFALTKDSESAAKDTVALSRCSLALFLFTLLSLFA